MTTNKATVEEWKKARSISPLPQSQVAELLFKSLDTVKSWDTGRNPIDRGLFNYFLLMTDQHPEFTITQKSQDK